MKNEFIVLAATATLAEQSSNIAGGTAGSIPYQTAEGTTALLPIGMEGQSLMVNSEGLPEWVKPATEEVTTTETNGYSTLPGGLILQWGYSVNDSSITFPVAFTTQCFAVYASQADNVERNNNVKAYSPTLTGCSLIHESPVYWFAIGK